MKEENNLNSVEPVTPVTPTATPIDQPQVAAPVAEPVQPQVQQVVEPQIDPTFGTNVEVPVQPVPAPTKKKSKLPVILVVILLLALGGGAAYYFLVMNKTDNTGNDETTTTTTEATTVAVKETELLSFKSLDDYITYVTDNNAKLTDNNMVTMDDTFFFVEYNLNGECKNEGDKISFTQKGLKIEYTCEKPTDSVADGGFAEWDADVIVNDKYKIKKTTATTCTNWHNFSNGKYFVNITAGCGMETPIKMEVESENNEKIYVGEIIRELVKSIGADSQFEYKTTTPVAKDNVLYFVTQESVVPETGNQTEEYKQTTCSIKYIDLNKEKPEVKDTGVSGSCYDVTDYKID